MPGDGSYAFLIIVLSIALFIAIVVARSAMKRAERANANRIKAWEITSIKESELEEMRKQHATAQLEWEKMRLMMEGWKKILDQKKVQFPWLASAIADFHALLAERDAAALKKKKQPAVKAVEKIREYSQQRQEAELNHRLMRYRVEYYEKLFPWITDYIGDDVPDSVIDLFGTVSDAGDDPAKQWLSPAEYERLTSVDKYQRALDNWRRNKKSAWQIGRDYERYVRYLYEAQGYDVEFPGALEGFEDMGPDVIARRGSELLVIQCKYWSQEKVIREKLIFRLFGSTLEYAFRLEKLKATDNPILLVDALHESKIVPVMYTSTKLSDLAKDAAVKLRVKVCEGVEISNYPMIKCNISKKGGERIYHLPFDQQYDRTKIDGATGEKYLFTVAEAEREGFRRAWRWTGSEDRNA
jgi:hypothetical protein